MATEHPKITAYIPKEILQALDNWKQSHEIKSRSEAIIRILENYLEVPHKVPQQGTANVEAALSAVLKELGQLKDRVAALEESISTASLAAHSTALVGGTGQADDAFGTAPGTVPNPLAPQPPTPLTQSALAKRLGCSGKAVENHRKQGDEGFAVWSRARDPDNIAWTWEGQGGRGHPLRFVPLD